MLRSCAVCLATLARYLGLAILCLARCLLKLISQELADGGRMLGVVSTRFLEYGGGLLPLRYHSRAIVCLRAP
jgi:hypothetical protein